MSRILMITDGRFSDRIRVSNEARALAESGHEVLVHALDARCEGGSFQVGGVSVTEHRLPAWCHWARTLSAEWPFYAWVVGRVLRPVLDDAQP